jgi:hypothetical protein
VIVFVVFVFVAKIACISALHRSEINGGPIALHFEMVFLVPQCWHSDSVPNLVSHVQEVGGEQMG